MKRTSSLFLSGILFGTLVFFAGLCEARPRQLDPAQIEAIRVMGANNHPVKVMVVLQPERNLEFVVALINLVAEIHRTDQLAPADRFKVHVVPSEWAKQNDCAALRARIDPRVLKDFVEFNPLFATTDVWMQDWGEVGMIKLKSDPKPQLLIIDSNRGRGIAALPAILANLWSSYLLKNPSEDRSCGDYGGNIEVTPDDVLVLGNTSTQKLRDFFAGHGYKNRMVVVETDWLKVGHCDEYMSICPNPKAPAGYSLIKANPRLALKLLERANRDELAAIPIASYRSMMLAVHDYLNRARKANPAPASNRQPEANSLSGHAFSRTLVRLVDATTDTGDLPVNARGIMKEFVLPPLEERTNDPFIHPTNRPDIPSTITRALGTNRPAADAAVEKFIQKNLALATLIDSNVQTVSRRAREITGDPKSGLSVLSFPVLYHEVYGGKHIAYLPGVVNQLILRSHLVIPDPHVEVFRAYIARVAGKVGLHAHFLENMFYHNAEGEIHCGTNVFRHPNKYFVKPRALPAIWDTPMAAPTR
jgi:hypothetical protein